MTHQFGCSACGFMIRSDDDREVIDLVRTHADEKHDMDVSEEDVRNGWEEVEAAADD
ncbi:DUF1059 domain-containing protein [Haloarcula nitratireducens]|uniref:DUF1059 domain-containing protein n=1 Tax=Haloarcula nitratireducens TaxID=2487749 RepID=A0AAW4P869_9EURY|nr:DUF1059 domain-containing protein [Halomicroarcula nitratireducens]MBX0294076.1 DUF1059 domain-containing protein [Halomicroarcula nitratireducens]